MLNLFWTQNIPINISTSAHISWGDSVVSCFVSRVALLLYDNVDCVPCGMPLLCVFLKRESATLHVFMGNNLVSAAPWTHQKGLSLRSRGCPQGLSMGAIVHASQLMLHSADLSDQRTSGNFREWDAFLLTCVFSLWASVLWVWLFSYREGAGSPSIRLSIKR